MLSRHPSFPRVRLEKASRAKRRRRTKEDHEKVRKIHRDEEEEAPTGQTAGAPSDRVVALIAANKVNGGGSMVYGSEKGDTGKGCSATDAAATYIALVVVSGLIADWSEDAMEEELPDPPPPH